MKEHFVVMSLILILGTMVNARPRTELQAYWNSRARILKEEQRMMIGGNLDFEFDERQANEILMTEKRKELDAGFQKPNKFPPARNFIEARQDIEKSEVFRILKQVPKGAVLHSHDTAIVSFDYVYQNITFRDGLYVCDVDNTLSLKFFDQPDEECEWQLLSEVRKNPELAQDYNNRIRRQMTMVTEKPGRIYTDVNKAWTKFMSIFMFISPMLHYKPVYEDHFYQGLKELYEDNVMYLELRSTLTEVYDLNGTTYGPIEVVRLYSEVTQRFMKDHPDFLGVKIIYAPVRSVRIRDMDFYLKTMVEVKTAFPSFVIGFDLVGQEDKGKTLSYFANKLQNVSPDIKFFFHAGETKWNGMRTDENLIDAVLLNTSRVGHGYALLKHPHVMDMMRERNIAVEVNPISNQVLCLVKDLRNHPAARLFAEGYPVVISNDDPGLWGAKALSYDFYEAFMGLMSRYADLRAVKQLALNSLNYSSMDEKEKRMANEIWRRKWDAFVKKLISPEGNDVSYNVSFSGS